MTDTSELEKLKAEVEVKAAEVVALKAQVAESESPLAKAKQEAEDQKAIDEAHLQSAEAQQKQISALIPDLSKVTPAPLEVKGETPLFGASLAQRAANAAACRAAQQVREAIGTELPSARILVTSDPALATSDAIYVEVLDGLEGLNKAAEGLLDVVEPSVAQVAAAQPQGWLPPGVQSFLVAGAAIPIAKAVAAALPGALSLLTAHRTLSTSLVTVDSFAAAAAAAGELSWLSPKPDVFHDEFRLLPTEGTVKEKESELADKRQELVALKVTLEDTKLAGSARLTELNAEVKESEEKIKKAREAELDDLQTQLAAQRNAVAALELAIGKCALRIALIDSATSAIDQFTTSMRTTAAGATRSPLAAAILREQLHGDCGDAKQFTHVLLVKAEPGSAQQLIDDGPLMFKDKFTVIATSNVTYMLIETKGESGNVIRAGSIGGEATAHGTVGKDIEKAVEARAMEPAT
jgi:hypothetical protein